MSGECDTERSCRRRHRVDGVCAPPARRATGRWSPLVGAQLHVDLPAAHCAVHGGGSRQRATLPIGDGDGQDSESRQSDDEVELDDFEPLSDDELDELDDEPPSPDEPDPDEEPEEPEEPDEPLDVEPDRLSVLKNPLPLKVTPTGWNTFFTASVSPDSGCSYSVSVSSVKACCTSMVSPVSMNL